MNKTLYTLCFTFILMFTETGLHARQPYKATISVSSESATVTAPNLLDLRNDLRFVSIKELIPIYTPVSLTTFDIDLRGLQASAIFPANSTTLILEIPEAGITKTFTGGTRDESITLFKEYIRDGGTDHNLLKAYAKYSPIDPIAGNANCLTAQMAQADYMLGHLFPLSGCNRCTDAQPVVNQVQVGLYTGRIFAGGFDTTSVTIPLRYSYSPSFNKALIIDAPITYLRNGGASSFVSSLGVGYRFPVMEGWSMTPVLRIGGGGSLDLCTSAAFISAGVTSVFNYKITNYVFSLTNYVGSLSSTNLWLSGVNFNYRLKNYVFKNGLTWTTCNAFCLGGRPVNCSLSIVDSFFGRNQLYIRHYDEISFSFIINNLNPRLNYDSLSIGFAFQFGQHDLKGYFMNLAYQF